MSASPDLTDVRPKGEKIQPLLEVRNLVVHFPFSRGLFGEHGVIRAVDGVSFTIRPGETLGLVGESGCGKTTTARAIVGLVQPTAGEIRLAGTRIDGLSPREMFPHRRDVQMIFQDPYASLNPRMTVGSIVQEPMDIFGLHDVRDRKLEVMRLLDLVGLNPRFLNRYPHEFSGGQRQRIGIARALAVKPKLIICDEPVSALDVSIQAQVINLLMDLQQQLRVAYLFISHDLSVVRHISQRIGVMYLGRLVELAHSDQLHEKPLHPYTQALLSAAPIPDPALERRRQRIILRGEVPSPDRHYSGCQFADRCPLVEGYCRESSPRLKGLGHKVACFKVET
ncbi:MAG TPA: oligopeptide/dipeptide ABC transporter ATP-binding protein [Pirellulaceae bacterium]|jgi:oligopeptide transport system ATP-binding protein|nr:oligopeptide/dipeptide ABC transporter ATP-binding protein [Pirellulaceae bacterium]